MATKKSPVKKKKVLKKSPAKKKPAKKAVKKTTKKVSRKSAAVPNIKKIGGKMIDLNKEKPVGKIIHFYGKIKVGVIEVVKGKEIKVGQTLYYSGHTTDFAEELKSMQEYGKQVMVAKGKKQVGIKVGKKVRQEDRVYKIQ
ncbi:MAG: hypothetical protein PHU42_03410 [Patescibacteria group bacterium]|nr:hypothetical protein [Patescibacteria group bacterium]